MPSDRPIRIAPSLLSADFAALGAAVCAITRAGADLIHFDVMDGHFVPNITIGPAVIKALRSYSTLPFDVHLMIAPADPYLVDFVNAGANIVTIHPEACPHLHRSLQTIRASGAKAGIALNPATPLNILDHVMDIVDLILVMTVNPGFGGQVFLPLEDKISAVAKRIVAGGRDIALEVDGGITPKTAFKVRTAGADTLVAGTSVFAGGPTAYAANIAALRGKA